MTSHDPLFAIEVHYRPFGSIYGRDICSVSAVAEAIIAEGVLGYRINEMDDAVAKSYYKRSITEMLRSRPKPVEKAKITFDCGLPVMLVDGKIPTEIIDITDELEMKVTYESVPYFSTIQGQWRDAREREGLVEICVPGSVTFVHYLPRDLAQSLCDFDIGPYTTEARDHIDVLNRRLTAEDRDPAISPQAPDEAFVGRRLEKARNLPPGKGVIISRAIFPDDN